ncbi:hypothetical protein FOXB_17699 [Fusarium oxysporum f. sp. conglutinans Fo5176]|uniref:Uncharacterized protein n=1 Tax=Fusarium oxysporum (strain Fo5176) TaxID=660025 RepID=F9GGB5_FUSOF|nr:hypothetical protein FOXB_17699 [Fusarium oxysporum f. sp. conglutinans Fo5176]
MVEVWGRSPTNSDDNSKESVELLRECPHSIQYVHESFRHYHFIALELLLESYTPDVGLRMLDSVVGLYEC